ncbi:Gfo/Idh/MocA family oxidoreductase [Agromyces protaetiae]|uniref:Gfo/Idh/MocA family oxidoreductase n=1 Tax=Agromyces protaetiae TaxID=2509455 RepID=A0A4P6FSD8_9MICO|nr:Gfo/Idh/MocA family oxidoreductase [Agromyces protaetiae]QAY73448.1 Gfo/Idh/MocA family oxidoreductase [Agromyces protaetiae]
MTTAKPTTAQPTALRAAIVGCGIIGLNHARAIARVDGIDVAVLVDPFVDAAERLAGVVVEELGAPRPAVFADLDDALARSRPDVVVICTPSGMHVEQAAASLDAGAHVVIEKPLDVDLARARRIQELADGAERSGTLVSVISQHRFDPASVAVAQAVRSGGLGRITSAVASVAWWRSQAYYDSGQWRGTWELDGGGALMNQGVHTVDLLLWFLGRPVEVSAQTARLAHERIEVEDVAVATVRFESGALAVLHATTAAYPGTGVRLSVLGSLGSAIIQDDQLEYLHAWVETDVADGNASQNQAAEILGPGDLVGTPKPADAFVIGHARQYVDIVSSIRDGAAPGVRVADAVTALAVVRSVYLSARLGRPIRVDEVLAGAFDETPIALDPGEHHQIRHENTGAAA